MRWLLGMIGLILAITSGMALAEAKHEKGWLGIHLGKTSKVLQSQLNLEEHPGIMILKVIKDTPAASAGLQANDILLTINDQPIDGVEDAVELIANAVPGDEMTLTFLRGGSEQSTLVVLGTRPESTDLEELGVSCHIGWGKGPMKLKMMGGSHGCDLSDILDKLEVDVTEGNIKVEVRCEDGKGTVTIDRNGEVETHEIDCDDLGHNQTSLFKIYADDEGEGEKEIRLIAPNCMMKLPKLENFDFDFDFENIPGFLKKHKIMMLDKGPKTQFKVSPEGQITVTTRKGDDELVLTFENEDDLAGRRPDLMEKYQELTEELNE